MPISKRPLMHAAVACAMTVSLAGPATAQDEYPSRTVEVINQFGPGGGTDMFIRAIGMPFSRLTRESMVGISVTGGGGVPAVTEFLDRPADGHTMMAIGPEEMINHALGRIDATEFRPVARVQYDQGMFYVSADSPFDSIGEVVEHARENPGDLSIAVTGAAGFDETLVGLWNLKSGAELMPAPFESSAESSASLLGGHTDLLYEEYGPSRSLIESGKLKPLVVFAEERLSVAPDVPTAVELGFDVTLGRWRGLALKEGDSQQHAESLYDIIAEAATKPDYKNIEKQNALHYRSKVIGPDEFQSFMESEMKTYAEVLGKLGYID